MKKLAGIFCAFLMGSGLMASGASTQSKDVAGLERFYQNLDANDNGQLTEDEFLGFWTKEFHKNDRNDDGVLDQTELLNSRQFETKDKNKDGVVDLDEEVMRRKANWNNYDRGGSDRLSLDDFIRNARGKSVRPDYDMVTTFTKMDADKDGNLTREEYLAFWQVYLEGRDVNNDRVLDPQEHGHAASFNSFDQNRNGKIDQEEDQLIREKDFGNLDKDGNGVLSQVEFVQ